MVSSILESRETLELFRLNNDAPAMLLGLPFTPRECATLELLSCRLAKFGRRTDPRVPIAGVRMEEELFPCTSRGKPTAEGKQKTTSVLVQTHAILEA